MAFGLGRRRVESKPFDQQTTDELCKGIVGGAIMALLFSTITLGMFYHLLFYSSESVWFKVYASLILSVTCVPITALFWGGVVVAGKELRRRNKGEKKSDQS